MIKLENIKVALIDDRLRETCLRWLKYVQRKLYCANEKVLLYVGLWPIKEKGHRWK